MIYFEAIIGLLVGIGVFMFGMYIMGEGLERAASGKMRTLIGRFTNNRFAGVGVGAAATAAVHSSTAVTVMVVGFVNIGIMTLNQAASVIMGANIGTTLTGVLVALSSLNMSLYLMLPVFIGVILILCKSEKTRRIGTILAGLGLIFVGLNIMNTSVLEVSQTKIFHSVLGAVTNPMLLMLLGALITAVLQSSTAVNGLIIVLAVPIGATGGLDIVDGIYIILGTNVGTCITSMIAAVGTNKNAKCAAMLHLLFNVIGTVIFGTVFMLVEKIALAKFLSAVFGSNVKFQIAWFNLCQNLICTAIMLPFIKPLVRLSEILTGNKPDKSGQVSKKKKGNFCKKDKKERAYKNY